MKPNAWFTKSVISIDVNGLSLAKIKASICGIKFEISMYLCPGGN
jgi:hypothetical protein